MAGGEDSTGAATPRGPDCPTGNTAHSIVHHFTVHVHVHQHNHSLICCVCVQEKDAEYRTLTEEVETLRKNEITLNLNIAECADVSSIVYNIL